MAQLVVGGPLGEADLRDQLGPAPSAHARWSGSSTRTATSGSRAASAASQTRASSAPVEPGSRVPDVSELLVIAGRVGLDTPRAAARRSTDASAAARSSRRRRTPGLQDLQLAPGRAALARVVRGAGVLGDQSFPVLRLGARRASRAPSPRACSLDRMVSDDACGRSAPRAAPAARSTAARAGRRLRRGGYRTGSARPAAPSRSARRRASSVRWMRPCSRWKPGRTSLVVQGDDLRRRGASGARSRLRRPSQRAARSTGTGSSSRCRAGTRCAPRPRPAAGRHLDQRADAVVLGLVEQRTGCQAGLGQRRQHRADRGRGTVAPCGRRGAQARWNYRANP